MGASLSVDGEKKHVNKKVVRLEIEKGETKKQRKTYTHVYVQRQGETCDRTMQGLPKGSNTETDTATLKEGTWGDLHKRHEAEQ